MLTPGILAAFEAQTAKMSAAPGVETLTGKRHVDEQQTEVAGVVQAVSGQDFLANLDALAEEAFGCVRSCEKGEWVHVRTERTAAP